MELRDYKNLLDEQMKLKVEIAIKANELQMKKETLNFIITNYKVINKRHRKLKIKCLLSFAVIEIMPSLLFGPISLFEQLFFVTIGVSGFLAYSCLLNGNKKDIIREMKSEERKVKIVEEKLEKIRKKLMSIEKTLQSLTDEEKKNLESQKIKDKETNIRQTLKQTKELFFYWIKKNKIKHHKTN